MFETAADLREFWVPLFTEEVALLPVLAADALELVLVVVDLELFILVLSVEAFALVLDVFPRLVLA